MNGCKYCQKGKSLNHSFFGDITLKTYILGNLLITEAFDSVHEEDDYSALKINVCPICKGEVQELPDEEMEEEIDD